MSKTRAIRLSDEEEVAIQRFLELNPYLDFSTLARISIFDFIKDPKLKLEPVKYTSKKSHRGSKRSGSVPDVEL